MDYFRDAAIAEQVTLAKAQLGDRIRTLERALSKTILRVKALEATQPRATLTAEDLAWFADLLETLEPSPQRDAVLGKLGRPR